MWSVRPGRVTSYCPRYVGPLDISESASLAPLVDEILPVGPGKLANKLHIAESWQLVGAHTFLRAERRIETTDQIDGTSREGSQVVRD
jgi:hypothetical protein